MKRGWALRAGWALAFLAVQGVAWAQTGDGRVSFVARNGEAVENAKIVRVEPDGVSVMRAEGIAKFSFELLPDEMRERFHMTPESVGQFREKRAAADRERFTSERADDKGNYVWHPAGREIVGSFMCVKDGRVLIQGKSQFMSGMVDVGRRVFWLADLPASEQERVSRLARQQSPEAARAGEQLLNWHLQGLGQ